MLAVVVLTYRARPQLVRRCLDAVHAAGGADRVLLVDNGATVSQAHIPPGVALTSLPENRGYAGGMNAGLAAALAAGATTVVLLNDDTAVTPGWLTPLAAALDAGDRIGAAQPKLLLAAEPPVLQSAGVRWRADGAGIDVGYGEADRGQHDRAGELPIFSGAAVALSAAFLADVGGFDERYFMYYEDIDLALRGRAAGWSYRFVPESVVIHEMSTTASAMPDQRRYWQERNRLWCLFRHGTPTAIGRGLLLSAARLARVRSRVQAQAIADGLRGAPPRWRERRRPVRFDL